MPWPAPVMSTTLPSTSPTDRSLTRASGCGLYRTVRYKSGLLCRPRPRKNARPRPDHGSSPPRPICSPVRASTPSRRKPWPTPPTAPPARCTTTSAARTGCCSRSSSSGCPSRRPASSPASRSHPISTAACARCGATRSRRSRPTPSCGCCSSSSCGCTARATPSSPTASPLATPIAAATWRSRSRRGRRTRASASCAIRSAPPVSSSRCCSVRRCNNDSTPKRSRRLTSSPACARSWKEMRA